MGTLGSALERVRARSRVVAVDRRANISESAFGVRWPLLREPDWGQRRLRPPQISFDRADIDFAVPPNPAGVGIAPGVGPELGAIWGRHSAECAAQCRPKLDRTGPKCARLRPDLGRLWPSDPLSPLSVSLGVRLRPAVGFSRARTRARQEARDGHFPEGERSEHRHILCLLCRERDWAARSSRLPRISVTCSLARSQDRSGASAESRSKTKAQLNHGVIGEPGAELDETWSHRHGMPRRCWLRHSPRLPSPGNLSFLTSLLTFPGLLRALFELLWGTAGFANAGSFASLLR